ncbi:MAG TPA: MFS transporter [Candidatus Limnocylindrales bacterium]
MNLKPISRQLPLLVILAISFLGTVGMTIVFPVLPFLLRPYVANDGDLALWVGIIEAVYAACALLSAPILGSLSDRLGRKPVLVVSLIGSTIGWVLFGIGGALGVFLVARVIDGFTAGDMSVSFAYLADITEPEDRAKRFGLAGAVGGVGTLIGPALGGLLSPINLALPVFVAAALTAVTAVLALVVLPESLDPARRSSGVALGDLNPFRPLVGVVRRVELRPLFIALALLGVTMGVVASNVSVLALDAVAWGPVQIGLLLSGVGVVDIVVQGVLLGVFLKVAGERGVVLAGFAGIGVATGLMGLVGSLVPSALLLVTAGLLFAMTEGATTATLNGLLSRSVSDDEQGWLAGGMSAIGSATQLVVPILAGFLYAQVAPSAPYALATGAAVAAIAILAWRLPAPARDARPIEPAPTTEPA